MKKAVNVLIILAALTTVVAIVSRLSLVPVMGIESRAMVGFAMLLLLFAIALEGRK
ncbi:MAG TPA: hypothetical protein PLU24_05580 [Candidatus Omnitrophota bacterium]|nr:hypothetical protein [Candidatus Omnitrophota bacterium]